jgi:hypothetical protein
MNSVATQCGQHPSHDLTWPPVSVPGGASQFVDIRLSVAHRRLPAPASGRSAVAAGLRNVHKAEREISAKGLKVAENSGKGERNPLFDLFCSSPFSPLHLHLINCFVHTYERIFDLSDTTCLCMTDPAIRAYGRNRLVRCRWLGLPLLLHLQARWTRFDQCRTGPSFQHPDRATRWRCGQTSGCENII